MKKILAAACCILLISGCGSNPSPSPSATEDATNTITIEAETDTYQDVMLGNYSAKIPSEWTVKDNVFFLNEPDNYPFITYVVIDDNQTLDEIFSYTGAEDDFMNVVCNNTYSQSTYSHSEMEANTYGEIPALSFNAVGTIDDSLISFVCNLFDNPGGGILAVSLYHDAHDTNDTNSPDAIHDYLQVFYDMELSADMNASQPESESVQNPSDSSTTHVPSAYSDESSAVPEEKAEKDTNIESDESEEEYNPTTGERNALSSAKDYLNVMAFSYTGLIHQLEHDGYTSSEATYAADNCGADWNAQAVKAAQEYLDVMAFSYTGLVRQLEHDGYTNSEATHAADNCGADWNAQAVKAAREYLDLMAFSRSDLVDQLIHDGYTREQAEYGVSQAYN